MKKDKAITVLLSIKEYYNDKNEDSYVGFDDDDNEALDMAIKALEQQQQWIPVKWHEITEEEREREGYPEECSVFLDCLMPYDGQEILLTVKCTNRRTGSTEYYVEKDTCFNDGDGYYFDSGYDWVDDVIAWMPLPEPCGAESENQ